jgi:hypothetical protein
MRFSSVLLRLSGVLLLLLATTTMTTTICRVVGEGLLVNAFPMQWTVSTSLGRRTGRCVHLLGGRESHLLVRENKNMVRFGAGVIVAENFLQQRT